MNRFLLGIIVLFSSVLVSRAQTWQFGFETGGALHRTKGNALKSVVDSPMSLYNGLNVGFLFNNNVQINSGLHHLRQSQFILSSITYIYPDGKPLQQVYDYLKVPLDLELSAGNLGRLGISFGLYGGIAINAHEKRLFQLSGIRFNANISEDSRNYVFGGSMGLRYHLVKKQHLTVSLGIKYLHNFSNTLDKVTPLDKLWVERYRSIASTIKLSYALGK